MSLNNTNTIPPWFFDELTTVNVARLVISIFSIIGHSFILHLIIRFKKLRQRNYNHFVAMMVCSDLLIAIGVFIRGAYAAYSTDIHIRQFSPLVCAIINQNIQGTGLTGSQFAMFGIAIDRFLAIYKPYEYYTCENKYLFKRVLILAIIVQSFNTFFVYYKLDIYTPIPVCSASVASGPYSSYYSLVYSVVISVLLFATYFISVIILFRTRELNFNAENALKIQKHFFATASLILFCYTVFWTPPLLFHISVLIFEYNNPIVSAYMGIGIGFGNALYSLCTVCIYLFKYESIKECWKDMLKIQTHVAVSGFT